MIGIRSFSLAVFACAIAAIPATAQEAVSSFSVFGNGGLISSPTDSDRTVDFGSGVLFGGGVTLQLYERLSVRGSASFASGSGTDTTGGINEEVSLDRQFYGGGVEFLLMTDSNVEPYLYAGGGLVIVDRVGGTEDSYSYDVTELTGVVGAGVRFMLASNAFVFVDGTNWLYNNAVTDSANNDQAFSVGFGYRWGGN